MTGVRVIEIAAWIAAPAAGGILADWVAEVIKVEPLNGDPFRGIVTLPAVNDMAAKDGAAKDGAPGINPVFELDNRGKRSIAIDITTPEGRSLVLSLIEDADVLITNFRP